MDLVGDLCSEFMEIQRRDKTDHGPRYAQADLHQVRVPQRLGVFQAVDPLCFPDKFPLLDHFIDDMLGNTQFYGGGSAENTVVV
jgi:hypothetical protein